VAAPDGSQLPLEGGVLGKSAILKQNEAALDKFVSQLRIES
jgi:hypothetical protein